LSTSANTSIHSANNQNSHFTSPTTNFNGFPIQIVDAQHNQLLVHHPHHQMIDPRMDPNAYLHHHPHSILRSIIPPSPFNTPHHGPNGIPYVIIQQPQLPHQLHLQQHHQQQQQHHQQQQQQQIQPQVNLHQHKVNKIQIILHNHNCIQYNNNLLIYHYHKIFRII
jgi:hypothetical protein